MRTELEKLLKVKPAQIEKKLRQFKKFYHDPKPFEKLTPLQQARVLMEFIHPITIKEAVKIIENCGRLPKGMHLMSKRIFKLEYLLERGAGRCFTFAILYKILAQHLGIHDENAGRKCVIAASNRVNHIFVYFYVPTRKKPHIIDPTNGTFDKKPKGLWSKYYEPATEASDEENVALLLALGAIYHKETIKLFEKIQGTFKNNATFWVDKGTTFLALGQFEDALNCYNRAINLKPAFEALVWHHKIGALSNLERHGEAAECFDEVVKAGKKWENK